MRHGIRRIAVCSALAAGALVLAPTAEAVTPTTATITFDCGLYGSGSATLTATQSGTSASINLSTSAITAPIAVGANTVTSTLTLTRNGTGSVAFTGSANPAIPAGSPVSTGQLKGTVAAGDSLVAKSLKVVVMGITVTCNATSAQSPGPFVF
ncbi:hypothetical protein ACFCV8_22715 [Streptomyces sp. NPDC056347]|uniref:hypothetical protein n=1 Tax=unclassified Streptomyces TaxID=2593676 RepID=UPI0035E1DE9F